MADRCPIYQCGDHSYTKQFAQRSDGQWFYRRTDEHGRMGKWIPQVLPKPDYAWYNPRAGNARLPNIGNENGHSDTKAHFADASAMGRKAVYE